MSYYKKKCLSKHKMISVPIHPTCPYTPRLTVRRLLSHWNFSYSHHDHMRASDGLHSQVVSKEQGRHPANSCEKSRIFLNLLEFTWIPSGTIIRNGWVLGRLSLLRGPVTPNWINYFLLFICLFHFFHFPLYFFLYFIYFLPLFSLLFFFLFTFLLFWFFTFLLFSITPSASAGPWAIAHFAQRVSRHSLDSIILAVC